MKKNKIEKETTINTDEPANFAGRLPLVICLLLFVAVICVYYQATYNKFVFDDGEYLVTNLQVQRGLTLDTIKWAFTTGHASNWHPLTWISHMIDAQLYKSNPTGHHLSGILFHAINTVLLFLLLIKLTGSLWRSAFVASLFGLHPLHVESVAWISERKDLLSTFFWFCAILVYTGYAKAKNAEITAPNTQPRKPGPHIYYAGTIFLHILALMSKAMPVTLPFTLLLLDYWPIRRKSPWKKLIIEKLPFCLLSAGSCIVTYLTQKNYGAMVDPSNLPFPTRAANAFISYIVYIKQMFWPVNLSAYYPHPEKNLALWQVFGAMLLIIAVSYLVVRARKAKYLATGWFWYLITLVPVVGFVQVGMQAHADRYTYVPLIGPFIIVAWGAPDILNRISLFGAEKIRLVILGLCAAIVLTACTLATRSYIPYWQDDYVLFSHAIKVTKNNWIAHGAVSRILLLRKDYKGAMYHANKATKISPLDVNWKITVGTILAQTGQNEGAAEQLSQALKIKPDAVLARVNLAIVLNNLGKRDEAIEHLKTAVEYEPDNFLAQTNLASFLARSGEYDKAINHYNIANKINGSQDVDVLTNLAEAYAKVGRFDDALSSAKRAMAIAESTDKQQMTEILRNRLELYAQGKTATE